MQVEHNTLANTIHIRVDRSNITSHAKRSLSRMLYRIPVWQCIADVKACRESYEPLSAVDGEYEA
jgi:dipeptidyl-peptidase-3